jgi:predicted transcriptional regulator
MKPLNVPIPDLLKERLDAYALANGIHKKKVVELALDEYLKKAELRSAHYPSPT